MYAIKINDNIQISIVGYSTMGIPLTPVSVRIFPTPVERFPHTFSKSTFCGLSDMATKNQEPMNGQLGDEFDVMYLLPFSSHHAPRKNSIW